MRRRLVLGVTTFGLLALFFLGGCVSFYPPLSDEAIQERFPAEIQVFSRTTEVNGAPFHYVEVGDESKPLVVFIHGAPGAWDAFAGFLENPRLRKRYRLISVDRPGYGRSGFGKPNRSLESQAAILSDVFRKNLPGQKAILVGHSFGGPVAVRMAVDFPEEVRGLVLVAASVDPNLEETKWYQIPAHWKLLSWAVPRDLYSTNEEILPLEGELALLGLRWSELTMPVSVIHGEHDQLVPVQNVDFIQRMATNSVLTVERLADQNHFIPWSAPDRIVEAILGFESSQRNSAAN